MIDNSNVSKHLGKTSNYVSQYDPSLLVREPRSSNRKHLNIDDDKLPFVGCDVWNAYEISALNKNGLPVTAFGKITYPASSKYIVESKSLKLYLNSFNMTVIDSVTSEEINAEIERRVAADLSNLLETTVEVCLFNASNGDICSTALSLPGYIILEDDISVLHNTICADYRENPDLLKGVLAKKLPIQAFRSSLLKSNCRVTSQPDWGDVYIQYSGDHLIDPSSLLKYIVSFRDECHFHEEICETIYKRLWDKFNPRLLLVACLYVRRGGIDINPVRTNNEDMIPSYFKYSREYYGKTARQ